MVLLLLTEQAATVHLFVVNVADCSRRLFSCSNTSHIGSVPMICAVFSWLQMQTQTSERNYSLEFDYSVGCSKADVADGANSLRAMANCTMCIVRCATSIDLIVDRNSHCTIWTRAYRRAATQMPSLSSNTTWIDGWRAGCMCVQCNRVAKQSICTNEFMRYGTCRTCVTSKRERQLCRERGKMGRCGRSEVIGPRR